MTMAHDTIQKILGVKEKAKLLLIANRRISIHNATSCVRMNELDARMECRNLKLVKPQTAEAFVRRPIDIQREILNGIKLVLMHVCEAGAAAAVSAPLIRIPLRVIG